MSDVPAAGSPAVRTAVGGDAEKIVDFQARLGPDDDALLVSPFDPATGAELLRAALDAGETERRSTVVVAEHEGVVVGLVLCRDHVHPALSGTVQLAVAVEAGWRGRGVGTRLLARAVAWAERVGARRLQLGVIAGNAPAIALYEKAGFVREGTLRSAAVVVGRACDVHVMARLVGGAQPA